MISEEKWRELYFLVEGSVQRRFLYLGAMGLSPSAELQKQDSDLLRRLRYRAFPGWRRRTADRVLPQRKTA